MEENRGENTKNEENEVGQGEGDEVVVHGRVEALAPHDHQAHQQVAHQPAEEDHQVEDGDEDEADALLHPAMAEDGLQAELELGGVRQVGRAVTGVAR